MLFRMSLGIQKEKNLHFVFRVELVYYYNIEKLSSYLLENLRLHGKRPISLMLFREISYSL